MDDEDLDVLEPWTIKKISRRRKESAIEAARQEGVTVGEWLDRRLAEWMEAGMPVRVRENQGVNGVNPLLLKTLVESAVLLAGQERRDGLLNDARRAVRQRLRALHQPRLTAAKPENPDYLPVNGADPEGVTS